MRIHSIEELRGWLHGRLPSDWFEGDPEITVDREEILIVGRISEPGAAPAEGSEPAPADTATTAAQAGRIKQFREDTRERRIEIAREVEHATGRKVAWGVECGTERALFTTLSVPVMTRLRQPERRTLDTLVEAGVARSRSDALAWCVRLVGQNTEAWLQDLREAMQQVKAVREAGPTV
jgi:hypothetical protein